MCGILAIFGEERDTAPIYKGFHELKSRGPEHYSLNFTDNAVIGFRRLGIVDLSPKAMQPFIHNGVTVLCNGEIFNHKQLETDFQLTCESGSDCECIIWMYLKFGAEQTFNVLDGDFACIIYDTNSNTVYYARDRIGVRPLYAGYTNSGNFALASIAGALEPFCKSIGQVTPAIYKYEIDGFHQVQLMAYTLYEELKLSSIDAQTHIRNMLIYSCKKRLMSDRPIGCLLSGGLDSSIIATILCQLVDPATVSTFSIGMDGSPDVMHAEALAKRLGTNHTTVTFTPEEGFAVLDDVIRDLSSCDITTIRASIAMWLLAKWISKNTDIKVLYSGEGSDELFGGYLYFHKAPSAEALQQESISLINNLYLYDGLRADRCISSHGLELRVPFLDKDFVNLVMGSDPAQKMPTNGYEKYILRMAFANDLPESICWRRKDGMSDGVSKKEKPWYAMLQEYAAKETGETADVETEAMYYRVIYNEHFKNTQANEKFWMPKWTDAKDPSGRLILSD
jgi:asparagine synthase (glutamine-hydrolysing)